MTDCESAFSPGHPGEAERAQRDTQSAGHAHGPGHSHGHTHGLAGAATATGKHRRRLVAVLIITLSVVVIQLIGAIISQSLALLADAGHMLTDATGVAIALLASLIAALPATSKRTYGYLRVEVLAALINGIVLGVIAVVILWQAVVRFGTEVEVHSTPMLIAAVIGALANLISLLILQSAQKESLNVRGAYLEVFGDLLGSIAVIVAAIIIMLTGWVVVDQIASILIAIMIAPRAYSLLREVVNVLLEATPHGIDIDRVREHLLAVPEVTEVHDVHAWTITSGVSAFSAHVTVSDAGLGVREYHSILDELHACLLQHFGIGHVTLQIEPEGHKRSGPHVHA